MKRRARCIRDDLPCYVCGALTDLPSEMRDPIQRFYERVADLWFEVFGTRGFVPHEHCDPIKHAALKAHEVDAIERPQIRDRTSRLIMVDVWPTTGGGIEVEMCRCYGVPVIVLVGEHKLSVGKCCRLMRGNAAVETVITYSDGDFDDAAEQLRKYLSGISAELQVRSEAVLDAARGFTE